MLCRPSMKCRRPVQSWLDLSFNQENPNFHDTSILLKSRDQGQDPQIGKISESIEYSKYPESRHWSQPGLHI
uniref:Ovule protein n=1 Tax=Strongyloides venezuelensis TaxID=75913 RepID=A0A0K0F134_STRVS